MSSVKDRGLVEYGRSVRLPKGAVGPYAEEELSASLIAPPAWLTESTYEVQHADLPSPQSDEEFGAPQAVVPRPFMPGSSGPFGTYRVNGLEGRRQAWPSGPTRRRMLWGLSVLAVVGAVTVATAQLTTGDMEPPPATSGQEPVVTPEPTSASSALPSTAAPESSTSSDEAALEAARKAKAAEAAALRREWVRQEEIDEARERQEAKERAARQKEREEKPKPKPTDSQPSYRLPVASYTITSTFGQAGPLWASGFHTGLDFAAPTGVPIRAVHEGTITSAEAAGPYGNRTILELGDGTELWFCHQASISVSKGQQVTTGQLIGRVGATGNVTGPHLHLEVHTEDGQAVDPMKWLRGHGLSL